MGHHVGASLRLRRGGGGGGTSGGGGGSSGGGGGSSGGGGGVGRVCMVRTFRWRSLDIAFAATSHPVNFR